MINKIVLLNNELYKVLNRISALTGTNEKRNELAMFYSSINNTEKKIVKQYFNYVYSPFIIFGIKNVPNKLLKTKSKYFSLPINDIVEAMAQLDKAFLVDKLTGNKANEKLCEILRSCDNETRSLVQKIIDRDLKIGMSEKGINTGIPYCLPLPEYMGAVSFPGISNIVKRVSKYSIAKKNNTRFYIAQEKADGLFSFASINDCSDLKSGNGFQSRRLKPISINFKELAAEFKQLKSMVHDKSVLHGEFTIEGLDRLTSNGVFKALTTIYNKKEEGLTKAELKKYIAALEETFGQSFEELQSKIRYTVWDLTNSALLKSDNLSRFEALKSCLKKLKDFKHIQLVDYKYFGINQLQGAIKYFENKLKEGKEGIILKEASGLFKSGKSTNCIKFKNEFSSDYKIVGFEKGSGKYKNTLGAIFIESEDGLLKSKTSGFTEDRKHEIWNNQEKYLGKIVEVRANDITLSDDNIKDGIEIWSLMHPRFIEIRDDKTVANTLIEISEERNAFNFAKELLKDSEDVEIPLDSNGDKEEKDTVRKYICGNCAEQFEDTYYQTLTELTSPCQCPTCGQLISRTSHK